MKDVLYMFVFLEVVFAILWIAYEIATGNTIAIHPVEGVEILHYEGYATGHFWLQPIPYARWVHIILLSVAFVVVKIKWWLKPHNQSSSLKP